MTRRSGYDTDAGICWQFGNPGDGFVRCKCPACSTTDHQLVVFGRCRSGRLWFWTAQTIFGGERKEMFGWADTEEQATSSAMGIVRAMRSACGKPVIATMKQHAASARRKEWNEAKRLAAPRRARIEVQP